MSPNSWITIAKLGIFMDITKNLKKNRKKAPKNFADSKNVPIFAVPK